MISACWRGRIYETIFMMRLHKYILRVILCSLFLYFYTQIIAMSSKSSSMQMKNVLPGRLFLALIWLLIGFPAQSQELFIHTTKDSSLYQEGWIDLNKNGKKDPYEDPEKDIDERVEDLLGRMTLEEKTCQL